VVAVTVGVAGAVRAERTGTPEDDPEVWVSLEVALSVTWNWKVYELPATRVFDGIVHVSVPPEFAPVPFADAPHWAATTYAPAFTEISHCQEYAGVPVEGIVPVTVRSWSTSNADALGVGAAGAVRAELTPTGTDPADTFDSVEVALSVSFSSNE